MESVREKTLGPECARMRGQWLEVVSVVRVHVWVIGWVKLDVVHHTRCIYVRDGAWFDVGGRGWGGGGVMMMMIACVCIF